MKHSGAHLLLNISLTAAIAPGHFFIDSPLLASFQLPFFLFRSLLFDGYLPPVLRNRMLWYLEGIWQGGEGSADGWLATKQPADGLAGLQGGCAYLPSILLQGRLKSSAPSKRLGKSTRTKLLCSVIPLLTDCSVPALIFLLRTRQTLAWSYLAL